MELEKSTGSSVPTERKKDTTLLLAKIAIYKSYLSLLSPPAMITIIAKVNRAIQAASSPLEE